MTLSIEEMFDDLSRRVKIIELLLENSTLENRIANLEQRIIDLEREANSDEHLFE
jgi:hypothetical protein